MARSTIYTLPITPFPTASDQESLDLIFQGPDLAHEVAGLVRRDARGDDGATDAAGSSERHLGRHVHVRHVLVLGEQRQMEQDGQRGRVRGQDDDLGFAAVEGLGGCQREDFSRSAVFLLACIQTSRIVGWRVKVVDDSAYLHSRPSSIVDSDSPVARYRESPGKALDPPGGRLDKVVPGQQSEQIQGLKRMEIVSQDIITGWIGICH